MVQYLCLDCGTKLKESSSPCQCGTTRFIVSSHAQATITLIRQDYIDLLTFAKLALKRLPKNCAGLINIGKEAIKKAEGE